MFDGSSIAGWKAINESDMTLMPDPETAVVDPFFAQPTLAIFCDILEPSTASPTTADPRTTAKKALAYLQSQGIGDAAYFGPEASSSSSTTCASRPTPTIPASSSIPLELPPTTGAEYEGGNLGHRVRTKGGYFPVPPIDSAQDLRSDMLMYMAQMGVPVEKHHHEVASAQHELGIKFQTLVSSADSMQIYKYCIHQTAQAYGKTGDFHAEAGLRRQRLGHARPPVHLEGQASRSSPATATPTSRKSACSTSAASSSTPRL
jgi:glutamine synthetase